VVSLRRHEADPDYWAYYQKHLVPLDKWLESEDFQRQLERDYLEDYDPVEEILATGTEGAEAQEELAQADLEDWM